MIYWPFLRFNTIRNYIRSDLSRVVYLRCNTCFTIDIKYININYKHSYRYKLASTFSIIHFFSNSRLLDVLMLLSIKVGCYKVSLECKDKMVAFYEQFGYVKEEGQNYMCKRYWCRAVLGTCITVVVIAFGKGLFIWEDINITNAVKQNNLQLN